MIGYKIHSLAKELWAINRSITGEGVRETLLCIKKHLKNLNIRSVPSGTKVFDWTVPNEWHVSEAYIISPERKKICDFSINNLHLVGYSISFRGRMKLEELQQYLHSLPEQPSAIPYITSYYEERWGFCLTQEQRDLLEAERLLENPRFDRVRLRSKDFDLEMFCLDLDRGFIADSTSYLIYLKLILIGVLLAFLADRFLELLVLRLLSLLSLFSFLIDDLRCFLEEDLILGGVYKSYWTILWGVGDTVFCLSS